MWRTCHKVEFFKIELDKYYNKQIDGSDTITSVFQLRGSIIDFSHWSNILAHVTECKTVLKSGLRAVDSGFQVLDTSQWILDYNRQWDSVFLKLYFRFQSPGFQTSQAKFFPNSENLIPL